MLAEVYHNWPLILDSGRSVIGIDQSQQMLLQANSKLPNVRTGEKEGKT